MLVNSSFLFLSQAAAPAQAWTPIELFDKGGFLMWPLLVLSIVTAIVFFTCLWTTRAAAVLPTGMITAVETCLRRNDRGSLMAACSYDNSSFARTVHAIVMFLQSNPRANIDEVREIAVAEGSRQSMNLTRQINWLSDIAAITPMIGLLGTVVGMMATFAEIASGNFEGVKQMQMTSGISEAMITTATGLILAIPSMAAYYFFRNRIQKSITDMEVATTHVLSVISVQMDREQRLGSSARGTNVQESLLD